MRIAVVGSGYVGLVTGVCFADLGHQVVLVDNDAKKLAALKNGEVPIHEQFLPELLGRHRGERISFSSDLQAATRESEAVLIGVSAFGRRRGKSPAASTATKWWWRKVRFRCIRASGSAPSS